MLDPQKLLEDLTEPQRQAATHMDGPLLIVAAAGSGKTRVITRRIAYLISQGIPAPSILAITFTNKAAGEMKNRVSSVLGRTMRDFGRLDQPWPTICTFHSLCLRILKHYAAQVELPPNFSVFDSSDQNKLIKDAMKALNLSTMNFAPATVHGTISNAKNELLSPEDFARRGGNFFERTAADVYFKYQELLKQNNALDFDDLLLRTAQAFRKYPDVLRELQDRFQYLLIDEYQDTNHAQYVIAHALALRHRNICVVGDPDQSIYAWRGADIKNILDFEKDYRDAKVVRLEQNYRSTKTILRIASELISHNIHRKEKSLWTENDNGEPASVFLCQDEHDEAAVVTRQLREIHDNCGVEWSQMAIFYRMNALSRVMEDALRRAQVPYQIARGVEFYNRKEIKDVLAYLRVIANPSDEVSLSRIANVPTRGLGDTTLRHLSAYAIGHGLSLWEAMEQAGSAEGISTRAGKSAQQFVAMVRRWRDIGASGGNVRHIMETVVRESGLEELLKKTGVEEHVELENVNELITSAAEFDKDNSEGTLADYLAQVSLVSDADHMKGAGGAVTLMTLHAAKGLEFPVVAMIGLEEGILPHSRAQAKPKELEEERRLCFVGITRAQARLILTKAARRMFRGVSERTIPSPFLGELHKESLRITDRTGLGDFEEEQRQRRQQRWEDEEELPQFRRGQLVRHPQFGLGRIAEVTGMGQNVRAIVEFNEVGRKTLVLQYARLELVGGDAFRSG